MVLIEYGSNGIGLCRYFQIFNHFFTLLIDGVVYFFSEEYPIS